MLRLLQPKVAVDEISSTLASERAGPTLIENVGFGQVSEEEKPSKVRMPPFYRFTSWRM
jgi:hypothetical protein